MSHQQTQCTCREDTEKRLTEHYAERLPDSKSHQARLLGYAITFGESVQSQPYMPVEVTHTVTVKKTGFEKQKTEKVNMFFKFCPFCGVSLQAAQKGGA